MTDIGSRKLVSIIIITKNALSFTKQCIQSIKKNTNIDYEFVFIDNGSTDGTVDYLQKIPNSITINNVKNMGFAKACNQGINASSGDYLVLLNNDTVVSSGWLEGLLFWLNHDKTIGIVGPRGTNVGNKQNIKDTSYSLENLDLYAKNLKEKSYRTGFEEDTLSGFCMAFHKDLVKKIGGFDEQFFPGTFEDEDFCLRTRILGRKLWVANDVFIHHMGGRSFSDNNTNYNAIFHDNRSRFLRKWQPHRFNTRKELVQSEKPFNAERHFISIT